MTDSVSYDGILVTSFGGPEGMDDVLPFLRNVTRGRNIPDERLKVVGEHYALFDGVSPINQQNRDLIAALEPALARRGIELPVYWGNRNWDPYLIDALRQARADGCKRLLTYVTSAFSSYSGCRQYRENIADARAEMGDDAPEVDKIRVFYNHPSFIEYWVGAVREASATLSAAKPRVAFTAHSLPLSMARTSDYEKQLREAAALVSQRLGDPPWDLVFQSRSGPPQMPWLEPDILDYLEQLDETEIVVAPLGFVSDHMEVLYDLDTEATAKAEELGLRMVRVPTPGDDPLFVDMIAELVEERLDPERERRALGPSGPWPDVCPEDCCPRPQRPPRKG